MSTKNPALVQPARPISSEDEIAAGTAASLGYANLLQLDATEAHKLETVVQNLADDGGFD